VTIEARGSLRVLVAADELPSFFSFTPGPAPGFEREVVEGFAKLHGLRLVVVPVEHFEQIIPMLIADKGDLILGLVDTPPRRQRIDFTAEMLPVRHLVVTCKPHGRIVNAADLRRQRVAVVGGSSWTEAATDAGVPAAQVVPFEATAGVLAALRQRVRKDDLELHHATPSTTTSSP
jgi:ABC-type amino acid transport substrate-binding protein